MRIYLVQLPDISPEFLPQLVNNFQALENLLNGKLQEDNLAAQTLTSLSIFPFSLGRGQMDDTIPKTAAGQYTGDGTANRTIVVDTGWMPRRVTILSHTDLYTFEGIGNGVSPLASWWRTNTGALGSGLTDWQGMVATGFKLGSAAANLSNKNTLLYTWHASR